MKWIEVDRWDLPEHEVTGACFLNGHPDQNKKRDGILTYSEADQDVTVDRDTWPVLHGITHYCETLDLPDLPEDITNYKLPDKLRHV